MVTINDLAAMAMQIAGKQMTIRHVSGPLGVRGRNSDNRLIGEKLEWRPSRPLAEGLEKNICVDLTASTCRPGSERCGLI